MQLLEKQENAIYYIKDNETREILYGGGVGGGKTALGCLWLIENCQKYEGSRWLMGRSKLKNLKETTLATFFELSSKLGISNQFKYKEQAGVIKWNNGSEIILKDLFLYPSDKNFDSLGSLEITGAFIDECNQIVSKAWDTVRSRIRYKLDEFGLLPKILGTCNPSKNWVYKRFYKPNKDGSIKSTRKFVQALPGDNPHLPESYIETLNDLDHNSKQRLLYGNWEYDNDPALLTTFDAILDMFTNDHIQGGNRYISADLAMKGRDKFITGYWDGLVCYVAIDMPKNDAKEIETKLKELKINKSVPNSRIVADADGLGSYLESYIKNIKEFHGGAKAKNTKTYFNLKSECAFKLAELINKRLIKIVCSSEQSEKISEEISICLKQKDIDADKKRIISKDEMKELLGHSPDYMDMLIMRMFFELKFQNKFTAKKR